MSTPARVNESAISYRWLADAIDLGGGSRSRCVREWEQVRSSMRATTQSFASLQDWISDFWICKTAMNSQAGVGIVPTWDPPEELDAWPVPPGFRQGVAVPGARRTRHEATAQVLSAAPAPPEGDSNDAVLEFYALDDAWRTQGDLAMLQAQHVRAWLATALGNLLSSIAFSPQGDAAVLVAESHRRMRIPSQLGAAPLWGVQFDEGEIGLLYNCRQTPNGTLSWRGIRIGQGEEWLKHWQWLSADAPAEAIAPAIALAARLMRCRPLLTAVLEVLEAEGDGPRLIALAIVRRWLLSLRVMAWLEDALAHRWSTVRAPDLACIAYNAVKPDWPRRWIGLSHRSLDAKPTLLQMKAWQSSLFAIDANYAPSWETNTGMMWGLFAAAPLLVRVRSPHYDASPWCAREAEIIAYLEETSDFVADRYVIDVDPVELPSLDRLVDEWRPLEGMAAALGHPEFPPMSMVYVAGAEVEWTLALIRAAAALRVFHALYGDADSANRLASYLAFSDEPLPIPPPTNNADGWEAYREIFRAVQRECDPAERIFALALPADTPTLHPDEVTAFSDRIPDLSQGSPSLDDVLAALEWCTTLLPILEEGNFGDMTLIDLRGQEREHWLSDPRFSLARGILALRAPPRPVWLIQLAGQRADDWGLPYDRPVFTQYTAKQFAWMMFEGSLAPDWPDAWADRCGLEIAPSLLRKCRETRG